MRCSEPAIALWLQALATSLLPSLSASLEPVSCPAMVRAMKVSKGLKQAYDLQDVLYLAAMSRKEQCVKEDGKLVVDNQTALSLARLATAWEVATDRVRILRGRPLPGSLKPEKTKPRRQPVSSEPSEEPWDGTRATHSPRPA
jgi:hypothetical protein